ncbi:TonB-dependent receptor [Nonlabens sp.]|uniref:TonB-dependent receptor n=1 Tax=Nonlabens sp. TaxID=1888209 RepID=UPI003263AFC6
MKTLFSIIFLLTTSFIFAQTTVSGVVLDEEKEPVMGVNVYLEGTYDGTTTDMDGKFSFSTEETSTGILIASYIGYEDYRLEALIVDMVGLKLRFRESLNALNTVVLSAGSFSAGDSSKASVLKPLDIVTTAGAVGDFVGALQTLPGTSNNADDGRLFVRGGSAEETQIFIDGARVFRPFTPTTGNIPTRGRFSPFLFDGISFSTGGYSAEYGDALSSVLLLNTNDVPKEEKTEIGIMSLGANFGNTKIWGKNSISLNAQYINLAPYNELIPQNNQFEKPYQSLNAEAVFRHQFDKGLFKAYSAYSYSDLALIQEDVNIEEGFYFGLRNRNYYGNLNYNGYLSDSWNIETSLSLAHDNNDMIIENTKIDAVENALHAKFKLQKRYNNYFKLNMGVEQFLINYKEDVLMENDTFETGINHGITGAFTEAEVFVSKDLAFKAGLRGDYYGASDQFKISPRLSAAVSINPFSQFSLAYGNFYQSAQNNVQQYDKDLQPENAQHYIANFLFKKNDRMFRAEAYYKKYDQLLTYDTTRVQFDSDLSNDGDGYATGLDLFWRDEKSIKNLDYWVSYSYLDTQRQFRNYPVEATPSFATDHNFSLVTKYWIEDLQSQIGATFNYSSGRPFTNANKTGFLNDRTSSFQSLNFNWAYLIDQQKILYFSVSNVLGRDNVFGYQYSDTPDVQGQFNRRTIGQAADRFFFVGFFWTIGGSDNQLDNL